VSLLRALRNADESQDFAQSRDLAVQFYPSYGYRFGSGWRLMVQGCVYRPQVAWLRQRPMLGLIRRAMRVERAAIDEFRLRMRQFLVHFAAGRTVSVSLDGQSTVLGPSELVGLFSGTMDVAAKVTTSQRDDSAFPWVQFSANVPEGDPRAFVGEAQLLPPSGCSIISDVDDTLKHSNVPDRRDLFRNTFVRAFTPIAGMPELYRRCVELGAGFHYVSGSPWQLYSPLAQFWADQGYPWGSFHLKRFRLRETARKLRTTSPQKQHKRAAMTPLLQAFPDRKFVLIGDSGEQDPEIYADVWREFPQQVHGVLIRAVRGVAIDGPRIRKTFELFPSDRWKLYDHVSEMSDVLLPWVQQLAAGPSTRPEGSAVSEVHH
jgi:phosphatidate phosphatase APP1